MAIKASTTFSLKDRLFNANTLAQLAGNGESAAPEFNRAGFERATLAAFPQLELKERITCMVEQLAVFLPGDFEAVRKILLKALPPPLDPTLSDDDFGQYIWVVPGEYIATHGLSERYLQRSLHFLRESTKRFSAEHAIRPFLKHFPEKSLNFLATCAIDRNYHVRRLASEGTRPLLPWSSRVALPQDPVLALLNTLHADPTRYVTRSVANHINDISKSDPDQVLATLARWQESRQQEASELAWIVRHSLRTLQDRGHPTALKMLGFPTRPRLTLSNLTVTPRVKLGGALDVQFDITSKSDQDLVLVLKIYFLKANSKWKPKIFRIAQWSASKGEKAHFSKSQSFKPITTRALYTGAHRLELIANGKRLADVPFQFEA